MKISYDINTIFLCFMAVSCMVNIIVQMTKAYVPLPTKLWCILVALCVDIGVLTGGVSLGLFELKAANILICIFASFVVAFVAMYGFDTFKDLWQRFKDGENTNGNN